MCPCSAENCLSGCPCLNKYCSTFRVDIDGFGIVEGRVDDVHDDVVNFLGIPYAEPPERFSAAEIKTTLGEEVFDAKSFGKGRGPKLVDTSIDYTVNKHSRRWIFDWLQ